MAEWSCSGLQSRGRRFDSDSSLHTLRKSLLHNPLARVAELVDARDLKSLGGNTVPVRVRPRAPSFKNNQADNRLSIPLAGFVFLWSAACMAFMVVLFNILTSNGKPFRRQISIKK